MFGANKVNKQADPPGSGRVAPYRHRSLVHVYQSGPTAIGSTAIDLRRVGTPLWPRDSLSALRRDTRSILVKEGVSIAHLALELHFFLMDTEDPHAHGKHGQVSSR